MIQEIVTEIYHLVKERKPLPGIENPKEVKVPFDPKTLAKLYAKFSFSSVGDTLKELMRREIIGWQEPNVETIGETHIKEPYFIKRAALEALIEAEFFSNIALLIREIMCPSKGQPDSKEVILPPSNQAEMDAISALSAPISEVVADRYFEGKTIEEISVLRGVSRYVVRRHLTAGLHQLKKHFNEPYRVQLEEIRLAALEKLDHRLEGLKFKDGRVN